MSERLVAPGAKPGDADGEEVRLRPRLLHDFIGQKQLRENLRVFVSAARERGEALDHVFFSGPPGLGKTTLAAIVANELDVEFRSTSAPALEKTGDLVSILTGLGRHHVFFIDEIHRLRPPIEELLYTAMEDYEVDVVIGEGPSARTIKIPLPRFTLIGATTKTGLVSAPLYSRFGITARLDLYDQEEMQQIVGRTAALLSMDVAADVGPRLARSSRGTPRVAIRLVRRMRDYAQVWGDGALSTAIVGRGLRALGIDEHGLDRTDREILSIIIDRYAGGPVGVETLAISLGETADTLEDVYEPFLVQSGFLKRTARGRVVTDLAVQPRQGRRCRRRRRRGGTPVLVRDFSFEVPPRLIAQRPAGTARRRAAASCVDRAGAGQPAHDDGVPSGAASGRVRTGAQRLPRPQGAG